MKSFIAIIKERNANDSVKLSVQPQMQMIKSKSVVAFEKIVLEVFLAEQNDKLRKSLRVAEDR